MKIRFDSKGSPAMFSRMMKEMQEEPDIGGMLVFSCDANNWKPEYITPMLATLSKPAFGGIFPQIVYKNSTYHTGTLVLGLPVTPEILHIPSLSHSDIDHTQEIKTHADVWNLSKSSGDETLIVFIDGLSNSIAKFINSLFLCFGLKRNFIGGGAGSLSLKQKRCLITPDGLVSDSAVIARISMKSGIGVAHGWQPISESFKVTDADQNTIKSMEWQPAFNVYRDFVEAHSGKRLSIDNFYDIAKRYPFGINKLDSEVLVRDPIKVTEDKELICVGEVPKRCFVRILTGTPDSLIAAAGRARGSAEQSFANHSNTTSLLFSCISRALFLGSDLAKEIEVASGNQPLYGALTLGEIANNGKSYLEFYNKTSVAGILA
jgi:hypothetical protein